MNTSVTEKIHFENRDCVEAMKEFPDNFFDLAIVDPPYGDGSQTVNVERERERESASVQPIRRQIRPLQGSVGGVAWQAEIPPRYTDRERTADNRTEHGVTRIGGSWARKYTKKSLRGMLRRNKSILVSCFASHEIRSYGVETISHYHRPAVF